MRQPPFTAPRSSPRSARRGRDGETPMPTDKPSARPAPSAKISCVISDIDGTLVTNDKMITPAARAAVAALREAGIAFSIASSRPPRGLIGLIHALEITQPVVGFDGGLIVKPDLSVVEQHLLDPPGRPAGGSASDRRGRASLGVQRPRLADPGRRRAAGDPRNPQPALPAHGGAPVRRRPGQGRQDRGSGRRGPDRPLRGPGRGRCWAARPK